MVRFIIALVLAAAAIGACTLFDDDVPDDSCRNDEDCFRAQGEYCHRTKVCVPGDAGVDAP